MDYFIDLDKYYLIIKTKMWQNNDSKNIIARMATISKSGTSTLCVICIFGNVFIEKTIVYVGRITDTLY